MRGNPGTSRALNRRLILNLLRSRGAMPRAEIATVTGLSPAAVTFVVTELVEEGLVVEGKAQTGATGRRPVPVDINYDGHLAVGFKLRHDSIDCVLTDLATTPIASFEMPVPDTLPETMVEAIVAAIPKLLADAGRTGSPVMGVGVSIPGEVDAVNGICVQSPRFGWRNLAFPELLRERVHVPVWIDDDISAFTVAQRLFGAGRNYSNFATIAVGTGVGSSLVMGGEIYHGSHGLAGKLGHVITVPGGRLCECGRRGCLQAHTAEAAMIEDWGRRRGKKANRDEFAAAIEGGDPAALQVMAGAGELIGRHLADLVNLFDPEVLIAGGEAMQFGEAILEPIRRSMAKYVFLNTPEILPDWVPGSWARGAAALATQHFFDLDVE
ncbi:MULTISPECIES: ROK family transcriptional regulator [Rhizobium]|uniref:ROK family transcriptional regulator n=2 Tax=Rhizobium tropici TaxID=398 RepID=A0A6P1CCT3_RHITR|nr:MULTISPECIES: ROK family transcriptional regulator [Rhizobium]AGB74165.1 ROK-family transcriptional regulator [Rhizobium tropici CIAT 899]NEV12644.1 ROK family transcriptional regulator [Rhizobium tropici]TGF01009.1 ROK family transcriptional regulator [Rhizobium sp. SEMIA 4088]